LFGNYSVALYGLDANSAFEEISVQNPSGSVPTIAIEVFNNFIIKFERKKADSSYETIIFREIFGEEDCSVGDFNARIPFYLPNGDGKKGTISYNMQSLVFRLGLLDDTFRVRFYVYDRSGNKSNVAVSPDFILSEITQ